MQFKSFSVDYAKILEQNDLMAVTKLLAVKLMQTPYLPVGDFIKDLNNSDLNHFIETMDEEDEEKKPLSDLLLLAEMLATAEGCSSSETSDEFMDRVNTLSGFFLIESLYRKGLVKVYHNNMSFHEDMKDELVVEALK